MKNILYVSTGKKTNFTIHEQFSEKYDISKDVAYELLLITKQDMPEEQFEFRGVKYNGPFISGGVKDEFTNYRTWKATPKLEEDVEEMLFEDEITCPVCGSKQSDSWEACDDSDDEHCDDCGATYSYERNIEVSYTSNVVKYPKYEEFKLSKLEG